MESFPLFFRIRAITFMIMIVFSFLWFVLLSVEMFARWTMSDQISHSLMILFIITNTITLILLPILILVRFRAWLDAARLFLLLVLQAGSAAAGTYWSPKIQCPNQATDDIGVCQLISVYTEIACWIIPGILVFYSVYFAIVVYLQSWIPVVVEPERRSRDDPEMGSTNSPSSWREMLKEIFTAQSSDAETNVQIPQPLVLLTMVHAGPSSLSHSSATSSQSTMPHSTQQHTLAPHSAVPSRHHSLPAFQHGNEPHIRPVLTLPIPHPNQTPSLPQTPSSYTYSNSSPANPLIQSFGFGPDSTDVGSRVDRRWRSKHLSIMPAKEAQGTESLDTTRSKRARLTKPLPAHFL